MSTMLATLRKSSGKTGARLDKVSEFATVVQSVSNSNQETLDALFAEPDLLQSLWHRSPNT